VDAFLGRRSRLLRRDRNDHDCPICRGTTCVAPRKGWLRRHEREGLYALAFARHEWLYRYFRLIFTGMNRVRELPAKERTRCSATSCQVTKQAPIGGNGPRARSDAWRTYNQLRERRSCVTTASRFRRSSRSWIRDHSGAPARERGLPLPGGPHAHLARLPRGPTLNRELSSKAARRHLIVSRYDEFAKPRAHS